MPKGRNLTMPNYEEEIPQNVLFRREISEFSLSVRSRNCLNNLGVTTVGELVRITDSALLKTKNLGRKSLQEIIDLLSTLGLRLGMNDSELKAFQEECPSKTNDFLAAPPQTSDVNTLFKAIPWMAPIVAKFVSSMILDAQSTVGSELNISGLKGSDIKIADALRSLKFEPFGAIYDSLFCSLQDQQQVIVAKRTHIFPPQSLENLGKILGVTRERVRQVENDVREIFLHRYKELDVVIQSRVFRVIIGKVAQLQSAIKLAKNLVEKSSNSEQAFYSLIEVAGPYKVIDGWLVRMDAYEKVYGLRSRLVGLADRIGRIDPLILGRETAGLFRREVDRDRFLIKQVGLHKIFDEWVISDSNRRRVLLSLYKIGKPATKEEIAQHSGIKDLSRVSSYLTSVDFICRADKDRWAFIEWVDEPYEGISKQIEQKIYADGGKTALENVLRELPEKYGVSESSVRAYLSTPRFTTENGYVRLATNEEINNTYFGDVEDLDSAVRLNDGSWGARIRVEERFLNGYSASIPAAIAWENGIKPGDSHLVKVVGTEHFASLIWRVDSPTQTIDFGRISPILADLNVYPGDEVIVIPSVEGIRIFKAEEAPIDHSGAECQETESVPIESLMKVLFNK